MARPTQSNEVGAVRASQLVFTFGVGAVVNLPELSVVILGTDEWPNDDALRDVSEARLLHAVRRLLGPQVARLRTPVGDVRDLGQAGLGAAPSGLPVRPFPSWLRCSSCRKLAPSSQFKYLGGSRWREARFAHDSCSGPLRRPPARPVRFLVACEDGHLDDFPFVNFVHRGPSDCKSGLTLDETGANGDLAGAVLGCGCGARRYMFEALQPEKAAQALGACRGRHPHLQTIQSGCAQEQRTLLLGTSGGWFSETLSVLYIPQQTSPMAAALEKRWRRFSDVTSVEVLRFLQKQGELDSVPGGQDLEAVLACIGTIRGGGDGGTDAADLLTPEWQAFTAETPPQTTDFRLRNVAIPAGLEALVSQVALLERVRAVHALVGFSRLRPMGGGGRPGDPRRAPLARRAPKWVPAAEVRGEGIFLRLNEEAVRAWEDRAILDGWFEPLESAWVADRARFGGPNDNEERPTSRFVLLHSLAHALNRVLADECGYPSASLKERIYARPTEAAPGLDEAEEPEPMAGLLLYTAAPDSEGTLGGLVSLGEPEQLGPLIARALDSLAICASDPLCSEAHPNTETGTPRVAGAACHACLYTAETFCAHQNKLLDRAVLRPTLTQATRAFFERLP